MYKVLEIAAEEVGYLEKATNSQLDDKTANAGSNNYTKYARDLDALDAYAANKQGLAWCDMFVDWCFVQAYGLTNAFAITCQDIGKWGAGCTESANYYKSQGRLYYNSPQVGDQIFFTANSGTSMYHTGLVTAVDNTKVYTIEGNTSSASGVVANGGAVAEKSYSLTYSQIGGYGRPNYETVEGDENMTVEDFKELWYEMRKELQDNDASNYSADARQWAKDTGLIVGDENSMDMWEDVLTREQFVTVLYRFAQANGVL